LLRQQTTASLSRENLFGAGKAMAENNKGFGFFGRQFQSCRQCVFLAAIKRDFYAFGFIHRVLV